MNHFFAFLVSLVFIVLGIENIISDGVSFIGSVGLIPGDKQYFFPGITSIIFGIVLMLISMVDGKIKGVRFVGFINRCLLGVIRAVIRASYFILDRVYVFFPRKMMLLYRFLRLKDWAMSSYLRGHAEEALSLSNELLIVSIGYKKSWNYGNALHWAHTIKGLIWFDSEDFVAAEKELLLSVKVPLSPQLEFFGPKMILVNKFNDQKLTVKYLRVFKSNTK